MRILLLLLLTLGLTSCDGFDMDSLVTSSEDNEFTKAELASTIVFSPPLASSSTSQNRDGFIVLFNSTADLDEIQLSPTANEALIGNYEWSIVNEELQVTYPNGNICTSNKTDQSDETPQSYTASASCDNGIPSNDRITGILLRPLTFDSDDLTGQSINIDDDIEMSFINGGGFEITEGTSTEVGTYTDLIASTGFVNVVRVNNNTSGEYSLFVLLEGSMSSGTMLEMRHEASEENTVLTSDTLRAVFIYDIEEKGEWETVSTYDVISIDE